MTSCYRFEDTWYVHERHETNCPGDCDGCETCHRHCTCRPACAEHIDQDHPITAPTCVASTRADIGWIVTLSSLMLPEAIVQGLDSEATNLAGPAANPEAWQNRKASAAAGRADHISLIEPDDEQHPLSVLGTWVVRLGGAQDHSFTATLTQYASWIAARLHDSDLHHAGIAQRPDGTFRTLRTKLRACRDHLETVLHDTRTPERGVHCPACREVGAIHVPRLTRRYADHIAIPAGKECGRKDCRTCAGKDDTWHCPTNPEHWWTNPDYRARVDGDYLQHAENLTAAELHEVHGIPAGTVRRWVTEEKIRSAGRNAQGLKVYPVATALELRTKKASA